MKKDELLYILLIVIVLITIFLVGYAGFVPGGLNACRNTNDDMILATGFRCALPNVTIQRVVPVTFEEFEYDTI